jgi:hypothetical protein
MRNDLQDCKDAAQAGDAAFDLASFTTKWGSYKRALAVHMAMEEGDGVTTGVFRLLRSRFPEFDADVLHDEHQHDEDFMKSGAYWLCFVGRLTGCNPVKLGAMLLVRVI